MEVIFRRDPMIYDGSRANNAWLQETPKPITQSVLGQCRAHQSQPGEEDRVWTPAISSRSTSNGRKVNGPIWPQPGHPDNCHHSFSRLWPHQGGTRRHRCRLQRLQAAHQRCALVRRDEDQEGRLRIRVCPSARLPVHRSSPICRRLHRAALCNRHIIRKATLEDFIKNPNFAHEGIESPGPEMTLYPTISTPS